VRPGHPKIVEVGRRSVGIFNVGDALYALLNVCPHRGGPLCEGPQCGTTLPTDRYEFVYGREDGLVRCAWHGWEFDIRTGACLGAPNVKARTVPVSVKGEVFVHTRSSLPESRP
jgi:nitrite reductase/ring-hydroxylating ferredoxin subunit